MQKIDDQIQGDHSKLQNSVNEETITEEQAVDNYVSKDKYKALKSKFNGLKEVRERTRRIYLNVNQTMSFPIQEYLKVLGSWEKTNDEVRKLNAERR